MDRDTVRRILIRHYEFWTPLPQIDRELRLTRGTARSVIVQSWAMGTSSTSLQAAQRIAKEM